MRPCKLHGFLKMEISYRKGRAKYQFALVKRGFISWLRCLRIDTDIDIDPRHAGQTDTEQLRYYHYHNDGFHLVPLLYFNPTFSKQEYIINYLDSLHINIFLA